MRSRNVGLAVLLLALAVTAAWDYSRRHRRAERNGWDRTLYVLVYVVGAAEPEAITRLRGDLEGLGARLAEDRAAIDGGPAPFRFELVGPIAPERLPPAEPPDDSWVSRAEYALSLWRAERAARAVTPDADPGGYDVRVYLVLAPASGQSFAEGVAEAGGEVAVVRASLGQDALLAATAVAHEALHAVGATDKYDAAGHAVIPAGLYQPDRTPLYPQARAEIMVGEVPLGPGVARLPDHVEEIGVGPETAREIGWLAADRP